MSQLNRQAFTLVEVIVVIAVLGILATLTVLGLSTIQAESRDNQRSVTATTLADGLEAYYDKNGEYPSCALMTGSASSVQELLGVSDEALKLPQSTSDNAIVCTDISTGTTGDVIAYVGNTSTQCSTGTACVSYTLKYIEEGSGQVKEIVSRRTAVVTPAPTAPASTTTASISGSTALASATAINCPSSTPQYKLDLQVNDGTWQLGTWGTSQAWSTSADQGSKYGFRTQTRCLLLDGTEGIVTTGAVDEVVRSIDPPSAPIVALVGSTSGTNDSTVWSWNVVSCAAGSVRYSRTWSRDDATGWRSWSSDVTSTSYSVSTNYQGYEYRAKARARCVTNYTQSAYSAESSAPSYLRIVQAPGLATTFVVNTISNGSYDRFFDYTSPSCGTGTTIQRRQIYAGWNSTNWGGLLAFINLDSAQQQARWKNGTTIANNEVNWNGTYSFKNYGTAKGLNVASSYTQARLAVQHRCINTVTNRVAEGGLSDSGIRTVR